eukprot:523584-Amphidinium_carterae.2
MKAKSTPITTQHVTASRGEERARWEESINKELASFYNNHVVEVANPKLLAKYRAVNNHP